MWNLEYNRLKRIIAAAYRPTTDMLGRLLGSESLFGFGYFTNLVVDIVIFYC